MVIELNAVAVVVGATVWIERPCIDISVGVESGVLVQLVPPEPVEHEHHHGIGLSRRRRASSPGRVSAHDRRAEQRRDDPADVGTGVVRDDRAHS